MKRLMIFLTIGFPILSFAQTNSKEEINFVKGTSWDEVKRMAKTSNKYIFVDIFATWCGPCKMMDRDIYTNDSVIKAIRSNFIAVKLQMDSCQIDDDDVRAWYSTANEFGRKYSIPGYPSFFFFSPNGNLVYRDFGYKNVSEFVGLIEKAKDPKSLIYYDKLELYLSGKRNYCIMTGLSIFVKKVMGDKVLADSMAKDVKRNYLDKMSKKSLLTMDNFQFIKEFPELVKVDDNYFKLCYENPDNVDKMVQDIGWAKRITKYALEMYIEQHLFKNEVPVFENPDWVKIINYFKKRYPGLRGDDVVLEYQVYYYRRIEKWKEYFEYKTKSIRENPILGSFDAYMRLNYSGAWDGFKYCNDTVTLTGMIDWINLAISFVVSKEGAYTDAYTYAQELDTKAALLYKLAKIDSAIRFERAAIAVLTNEDSKQQKKAYYPIIELYTSIIDKMERREPTYIEEGAVWSSTTLDNIRNN